MYKEHHISLSPHSLILFTTKTTGCLVLLQLEASHSACAVSLYQQSPVVTITHARTHAQVRVVHNIEASPTSTFLSNMTTDRPNVGRTVPTSESCVHHGCQLLVWARHLARENISPRRLTGDSTTIFSTQGKL